MTATMKQERSGAERSVKVEVEVEVKMESLTDERHVTT
jgi:hypothetical protein